jgi:hypothetical protein
MLWENLVGLPNPIRDGLMTVLQVPILSKVMFSEIRKEIYWPMEFGELLFFRGNGTMDWLVEVELRTPSSCRRT